MTRISVLTVVLGWLVAGCWNSDGTSPVTDAKRWVAIEPTQCLTNPWEQDWLERNNNNYEGYPKDSGRPGLEPEEFEIIRDYYAGLGVTVYAGKTAPKYEVVCHACTCPEGHSMFLQVRREDVDTMTDLGYRLESPPVTPWGAKEVE